MNIGEQQNLQNVMGEKLDSKYLASRSIRTTVSFGALSDRGKVRENNEDHYAVLKRIRSQELMLANLQMTDLNISQEDSYLAMIADGVGGGAFGEVASELALRTVWEVTDRMCSWISRLTDFESQADEIQERVATFTERIQRVFQAMGRTVPEMQEMGTTFTVACIMGLDAVVVNLGDSRAYLFRDGNLHQISQDHTLAQELINEGVEEKEVNHVRHVLTRCFSAKSPSTTPDIHYVRLNDNDMLLLCTDGLSDMVSDDAIAQKLNTTSDPQVASSELVELALEEGGKDNVTVIVARVEIQSR